MAGKLKGGGAHIGLLAEEDGVHEDEAARRHREDQEDCHLHTDLVWELRCLVSRRVSCNSESITIASTENHPRLN